MTSKAVSTGSLSTKVCKSCGEDKPLSCYNKFSRSKDGLAYKCRDCRKAEYSEWRSSKSSDEIKEINKRSNLKKTFGITLEEYNEMLDRQKGTCAICLQAETTVRQGEVQALSVDHCHQTGKIRGLLCNSCNRALGKFKDSAENLIRAANYLKEAAA